MAGIYIPDMKMPNNCQACKFIEIHHYRSIFGPRFFCQIDGDEKLLFEERPEDCPLVAVPDHGRLIDAGDLYDGIDKKTTAFRADVENQKISQATEFGYWGAIHDARAVLTNAPTIIPADKNN